jgi:hypothetical protein
VGAVKHEYFPVRVERSRDTVRFGAMPMGVSTALHTNGLGEGRISQ